MKNLIDQITLDKDLLDAAQIRFEQAIAADKRARAAYKTMHTMRFVNKGSTLVSIRRGR